MGKIWRRVKRPLEAAEHLHFGDLVLQALFGWHSWAWGVGTGLVTLFIAAADGRSVTDVWLAVLIAGAAAVVVAAGISAAWTTFKSRGSDFDATVSREPENAASVSSPLQINIGEDAPFYDVPKASLHGITRRLKLELRNIDRSKGVSNCKVQITKIEPESGYRGPWILAQDIVLVAGDQTYIPIAQYGEARNPALSNCADTIIELCTASERSPLLESQSETTLTVRATGLDVPFCEIRCIIWVDLIGRLRIRKATTAQEADMPLLEAATQAYERTRGHPIAGFAEGSDNSPEEILRWYCYALIIPRESLGGRPLMEAVGTRPPSRVKELITVRPSHRVNIRPSGVYLMESGKDVFGELTVRSSELSNAIAVMSSWASENS